MRKLFKRIISTIFFVCAFFYSSGILAQGTPPTISNTGSTPLNFQEGSNPLVIVGNVIIEDNDSQNMLLATFSFGDNYAPGQDSLIFEDTDNIISHFDDESGTLRLLSKSASQGVGLGQMQSAMTSVQYTLTSNNPGSRSVNVNISVTDFEGNQSNTASRTINISPTNNAPRIISSNTTSVDATSSNNLRIFEDIEITDPDGEQLSRVEIEIVDGYNSSEDILSIQGNVGRLTIEEESEQKIVLTGVEPINTYENVISRFVYSHQPFFLRNPGVRTISLKVFDSNNAESNTLSRFLIIRAIVGPSTNFPPSLLDFSVETNEDVNYAFTPAEFQENFNDPNGSDLAGIIISALPEYGDLYLNENIINNQFIINRTQISLEQINNLTYRPDAGYAGSDFFEWNATDGSDFSANPARVNIGVMATNQGPQLSMPARVDVEEGILSPIQGITLSDPDLDELSVSLTVGYGMLYLAPMAVEEEWIDFVAGTDNGENEIEITGPSSLVAFALGGLTYQPDEGIVGADQLQIEVDDDNGGTASGSTNINIIISNIAPEIESFAISTNEDEAFSFVTDDFPYEDPDNGPSTSIQSISINSLPSLGVLVLAEDTITNGNIENNNAGFVINANLINQLHYLPLPDSSGTDSFSWNAYDGSKYAEAEAQVNITINPVNDAPVPSDFSVVTEEDQAFEFSSDLFANATTDPEGDALASITIQSLPGNGSLWLNETRLTGSTSLTLQEINNLTYLPDENYNGEDNFSWTASDGESLSEDVAQVLIEITPVNDPPILNNFSKAISENETTYNFTTADFAENYLDPEETPLSFIQITSLPATGSLLLNGTAIKVDDQINAGNIINLEYQPASGQDVGIVSFNWNASDGNLLALEEAQVMIIIGTGVTDFSISLEEDSSYSFTSVQFTNNYGNSDPEASLQSIRIEVLPENGTLSLNGETVGAEQEISLSEIDQLVYTPNENYAGDDAFSWTASEGQNYAPNPAQVLITIEEINDLPIIAAIPNITMIAGESSEPIAISISDQETAAEDLMLTASSSDETIIPNDQITLGGSGEERTITLTALPNTQGEVVITVTLSDGEAQVQQQFTATVTPYIITINVQDVLDLCIEEEESIAVEIQGGETPYTLISNCDQGDCALELINNTIIMDPSSTTTYFLSVEDANGIQSNVDTITVNVSDCSNLTLNIPTAFTPDGDQVNDLWEIENIEYATNVVVEVFNRYGEQVFRSEGYQQAWDGMHNNTMLPVSTYYYVISVDGGLQSYKGSVSILR